MGKSLGPFDCCSQIKGLAEELELIKRSHPEEYERFRTFIIAEGLLADSLERQVSVLSDYLQGIHQFNQTWAYAAANSTIGPELTVSSLDLKRIRLFYGEAFEQLATMLIWPACLNNIKCGRAFDKFKLLTLEKYRTIDKAGRANAFADNTAFQPIYAEFDSTLRNASHHAARRLAADSRDTIEYRSSDAGTWKRMRYSDYLLKCNRIQMCLMRLMLLQVWISARV